MRPSKRPRACDSCHSIKIKCELGSKGGSGPCSRCKRLGKECIITPPKRQKDRVAELEAQVKTLTKLLEQQKFKAAASAAGPQSDDTGINGYTGHTNSSARPPKKRKVSEEDSSDGNGLEYDPRDPDSLDIDAFVPQELQESLLDKYLNELVPLFPLCPIGGKREYGAMRSSRPLLLQAIVYAASPGVMSTEVQVSTIVHAPRRYLSSRIRILTSPSWNDRNNSGGS